MSARRRQDLKILYSFPHPFGSAGIGTTAWETVVALARSGHHVVLSTTSVHRPLPQDVGGRVDVRTSLTVAGRRLPHRAVGLGRAYRWHDLRTSRMVAGLGADVVHTWPRSCLRTLAAAQEGGVPGLRESPSPHSATAFAVAAAVASRVGSEIPDGHFHAGGPERLAQEVAEYAAATAVLAPSGFARSTFLDRGHPPQRVLQHRYGVDLDRFAPAATSPAGSPLRVAFVGRLEPAKGLDVLLEAWRELPPEPRAELLLVGEDTSHAAERHVDLLDDPSVRWLGRTSDVPGLLRTCHALALPSYSEGMALSVLEGMAVGLVPLVSDSAGAPVVHGRNGLIHPVGDVATLTEHLTTITSAAAREELREVLLAGRGELSWGAAAESLVACYRRAELLGPPG